MRLTYEQFEDRISERKDEIFLPVFGDIISFKEENGSVKLIRKVVGYYGAG